MHRCDELGPGRGLIPRRGSESGHIQRAIDDNPVVRQQLNPLPVNVGHQLQEVKL